MAHTAAIHDPKILFDRWFGNAIAQLEKLENEDGGTAGMMIVLPLYERYLYITMKRNKSRRFYQVMAADLRLKDPSEAKTFWETFRHGFCHTGMPFERARRSGALPKVRFSVSYSWQPQFLTAPNGHEVIGLDPWKFIHFVMNKYQTDPTLLTQHPDAPLLPIQIVTFYDTSGGVIGFSGYSGQR